MDAYERVLGDAMAGDATLFAREDYVEEAWRIVDPVLKQRTPVYEYEPGTWGPKEVEARVVPSRGWQNPVVDARSGTSCMGGPSIVKIEVLADADAVARRAAEFIAAEARAAVAARGRFALAVSGGRTPWQMLRILATQPLPWSDVHLSRSTSASRRRAIRTVTSPTSAKACSRTSPLPAAQSTRCRSRMRISARPRHATHASSRRLPAHRRCSISSISASDPTATRRRSFPAIRCSTSSIATLR